MVIINKRFPTEKPVSPKGAVDQDLQFGIGEGRLVCVFGLWLKDVGLRNLAISGDGPAILLLLDGCVILRKRQSAVARLGPYCTHYAVMLFISRNIDFPEPVQKFTVTDDPSWRRYRGRWGRHISRVLPLRSCEGVQGCYVIDIIHGYCMNAGAAYSGLLSLVVVIPQRDSQGRPDPDAKLFCSHITEQHSITTSRLDKGASWGFSLLFSFFSKFPKS